MFQNNKKIKAWGGVGGKLNEMEVSNQLDKEFKVGGVGRKIQEGGIQVH